MENMKRNIPVLLIICAFFALVLGVVNFFTEPLIEANKQQKQSMAFKALVKTGLVGDPLVIESGDSPVKELYPILIYGVLNSYLLVVEAQGYGGEMVLLAQMTPQGELLGALLTDNSETPGLGKNAENPDYMLKFIGKGGLESSLPHSKSDLSTDEADAVSGATVTFMGITTALNSASDFIKRRENK